ncbi:cellulase family glycosylhydrolase [Cellulomonas fengjieae]|uniref:cellulase family glycosylhydrolase n=1 Tax=Cellulomonas fengjieae TaxID=2819978 RepID=UPI001AAEBE4E|nr:cellulase family glycosylhydrolase [Cellulomonas fengjieae]MBO3102294.1 cellulase family glycosylhydrolase [Cellulomonas fengjieae]
MSQRTRALGSLFAALLAMTGIGAIAGTSAQAAAGCKVDYAVTNQWGEGFGANVTLTNLGDPLTSWTVGWTFSSGQRITQAWNGTATQSGNAVSVRDAGYNGVVRTGGTASFGFNGTWSGSNAVPTQFTVNGVACTGSAGSTPTPTPTPTSTTTPPPPTGTTPLAINGQLSVCGVNLCNQYGKPIQLRGASTHGLQWFPGCYNTSSLNTLADDWKADVLRIAMYVNEDGYVTDPSGFTARVNTLVDQAESRGMYSIIDFHTLTPGDPNVNLENAKTFFRNVATRNAAKKNVIYEIANEPNGVTWEQIRTYANQVIPIIKAADPDAVIIVGTRGWSSLGVSNGSSSAEIVANPLAFSNIMYAFHFYAASHQDNYRAEVRNAATKLPIFVTEWGTTSATGGGTVDIASSTAWLDLLDSLKISHVNWTYSDANESSAAFRPGTCAGSSYGTGQLTQSGQFVRSRIVTADSFPTS